MTKRKNEQYSENGAKFDGSSRIVVDKLKGFKWGSEFSVGLWFKRTSSKGYQGLVSNGYATQGSWEIRGGDEYGGQVPRKLCKQLFDPDSFLCLIDITTSIFKNLVE